MRHLLYWLLVDRMSIRARIAFSATCLERVLVAWDCTGHRAAELLVALRPHTDSDDLSAWDERLRDLVPEPERLGLFLGKPELSSARMQALHGLLLDSWEAGGANLFGGYRSEYTRTPTLRVVRFLIKHGIPVPSVSPFLRSPSTECNGLGNPRPASFFRPS